jgi:hypothetical protein
MRRKSSALSWCSGLPFAAAVLTAGCGDDDEAGGPIRTPDSPFGETAIVAVVNPAVNEGNTTDTPSSLGTERGSIVVDAEPGGAGTTDATGLAVIQELARGDLSLRFGANASLPFTVVADGDVYDLAVGLGGSAVEAFPNFPIRYAVRGTVVDFDSSATPDAIARALDTDSNIVFFKNGTYTGDLTITGDSVIFFGEGFTQRQVVIDGSVIVKGTGVRIRGFTITGNVTVDGNDFGMAFSIVRGTTDIKGNAVAFLRNAFCRPVSVPSSNATLLDNEGMAPMPAPPRERCP